MYAQGYEDDICFLAMGKFPNTVSGLIQCALHTVDLWLIPTRPDMLHSPERRNLGNVRALSIWQDPTTLHVGHVSGSDPGLSSDMEGTHRC